MERTKQMSSRPFSNLRLIVSTWYGALNPSFVRLMLLIILIFLLDTFTLYLMNNSVASGSGYLRIIVDAFYLVVLLLPVLYVLVLRPLLQQLKVSTSAESAMRDSFELLNGVFTSINEAVFIVSAETRVITDLNLSAEKMFGYTREELLGKKTSILHLDDDMYEKFGEMMADSCRVRGYFDTTYRMKRKNGSIFPSEHSVRLISSEHGPGKCNVYVVRDISEQVWREEELCSLAQEIVDRNQFVESVISNLKSGIIVVDRDYRIMLVNQYVAESSGESTESFVEKNLSDVCPELHDALNSGVLHGEIPVTLFNINKIIGFSRFDLNGIYKISDGYIINFRDLTEILKIRKELRHKERLSAMGEVVARAAHEMRNPLFAITSVAQILEMELTLKPAQKQLMDSLLKQSRRINDLVEELLDSTRELRLQRKSVDLNSIITESFLSLQTISRDKRVTLKTNTYAEKVLVYADLEKLEQVVINLVRNAMEASREDTHVDLSIEECVGGVLISVADSGEGIPLEAMDKIFDVFYTTKRGGTGLGLSICKNIVEAHGGTLEARNNPVTGATFTVKLPFGGDGR